MTADELNKRAEIMVSQFGQVHYILKGMYAPQNFSKKAPYVNGKGIKNAIALAQEKLDYLLLTRYKKNIKQENSFLDLRDGGGDLKGLPGKPVMTGWLTYAREMLAKPKFLKELTECGNKISGDFAALIVIGIGGSYTNIEGIINALNPCGTRIPVYFLGQHLSAESYQHVFNCLKRIKGKVAVNVISKSGTTTEPAIACRLVIDFLSKNNKLGAVFATTDPKKGALREVIEQRGFNPAKYITKEIEADFYIRENIGGRFSVITPVGLLPFAVTGINIEELLMGYYYAMEFMKQSVVEVVAHKYVAYHRGAVNAVLAYNKTCFREKILGFRQLWPECDGKDGKGFNLMEEFYTADAHSNGQLIKSGLRNMMEIFHFIDNPQYDIPIPQSEFDLDKLAIIAQGSDQAMSLHTVNNVFMGALFLDHWRSGVPVIGIRIPALNPFNVAMVMGVEHYQAVIFGLMLGINPVNQPGVQGYKQIAFELLGMKGMEKKNERLHELREFGII